MARRIGEPVMVRVVAEPDGAPGTFLWRDRVYVVRDVLGHWQERRSWWAGAAGRAVHGDAVPGEAVPGEAVPGEAVPGEAVPGEAVPGEAVPGEAVPGEAVPGEAVPGEAVGSAGRGDRGGASTGVLDHEREIWRVEASAGRTFGSGVYDLARDGRAGAGTSAAPPGQGWHLLRVAD